MSSIPRNTNSTDPKLLKSRVFIGNLATEKAKREDLTEAFERYGEVIGCSLLRGYGFVQFLSEEDARNAVKGENGKTMYGAVMDVRMAAEGKKGAQEKEEEPPPPREREREKSSSSKSRRRSRSPRRSKWEHPPPAAPHPPLAAPHPPLAASHPLLAAPHPLLGVPHPPPHPHDYHPPPHPHDYYPPPHPPPNPHNYYPPESYPPEKFPPAHSYPPQAYDSHYDQHYYDKAPPPPAHHVRHHSPPPQPHHPAYPAGGPLPQPHHPAYPAGGEWEHHESRPPPPAALRPSWEQDEHMRQRRHHSPRPPSPRPQWYRQSPPPPHSDWHRPPSPRQQGPPRSPRQQGHPRAENAIKFDMEIIVINKQQMDYANMVSRRVQDLGLKVLTKPLAPTASMSEILDNIAKKGLLYAVIITSQHELHGSLTLTILHGRNPQEHKNMPLEDALGLINRDFSHYCQAIREGHMRQQQAKRSDISAAAPFGGGSGGGDLTIEQISSVIDNLQQKKNELLKKQVASFGGGSSIQQQQADLQAKILSLLGSNAVVPPSTRPPPAPQAPRDYWGPY